MTPQGTELAAKLATLLSQIRSSGHEDAAQGVLNQLIDGVKREAVFATPELVLELARALGSAAVCSLWTLLVPLCSAVAVVANGVPGGHEALSTHEMIGALMSVLSAGDAVPPRAQADVSGALSQVALCGPAEVHQMVGSRELLHRAAMMLCGAEENVKAEAALLVNNVAAFGGDAVKVRIAGHAALMGAVKALLNNGAPRQRCRAAGILMHVSATIQSASADVRSPRMGNRVAC